MKILIIDDEPPLTEILTIILDGAGHETTVTHRSEAALEELRAREALQTRAFDVVISDYQMPGMNGLELLERSWAELATPPPFLFVSGSASARRELMEGGGAGCLRKPFSIEALLNAVEDFRDGAPERHLHSA